MRVKGQLLLSALMVASLAIPALAQGPGGPGGGGGGGGNFDPAMRAKMEKYRAQAKNHGKLGQMMRGFQEMDQDPATALKPAQAKSILAVVKPWQNKDKMTEDQAKGVIMSIQKVLTPKQLTKLGSMQGRGFGGGRGPGGGGGGFGGGARGPGGGGGGGGQRPKMSPADMEKRMAGMKTSNPFSTVASASDPFASRRVERNKAMFAALAARASGKAAAHTAKNTQTKTH